MRALMVLAVGAAMLAGCSDGGTPNPSTSASEAAAPAETVAVADLSAAASLVPAATAPRIAYVYRYALELPVDRAPALMARHEQACTAAGAAVCQVIGSETHLVDQDDLTARLEIRATPAFIAVIRNGLAADARGAGGRVATAATESEDLTRSLIDSEARLRAQTTLRDRLQALLATRNGSLEDLLKVESELARVQGEIDAEQSTLIEMRTRVATSRLSIEYRSAGQLAPNSAFRPVLEAVQGSLSAMMATIGVLITILAVLLPIGLIAGPVVWFVLKRRRARKTTPADLTSSQP